jgi:hypothetical protein
MMCSQPLDSNGDCSTPNCPYNPQSDAQEFEAEHEVVGVREGDPNAELEYDRAEGEPDMTPEELAELLGDDDYDGEGESEDSGDDAGDEAPEMDISQENLPETDDDLSQDELDELANEGKEKPEDHSENKPEDEKGQLDELPEDLPEEKQLTEEDKGEDPSDDAQDLPEPDDEFDRKVREMMENREMPPIPGMGDEDEQEDSGDDEGLPPRPQGCNGDCQPNDDPSEDDVCCPHCTAKNFRDEMQQRQEEGEEFSEEEMKEEWQNFLDDWANEARDQKEEQRAEREGDGSGGEQDDDLDHEPDEDESDAEYEQQDQDDEPEDIREGDVPEQGEGGGGDIDPDLPPRPDGCQGDCKPTDDPSEGDEPCPHCTAKQFKQQLQEKEQKGEDLPSEDEIGDMFQDFLKDWNEQKEQGEKPEDEAPPEDEPEDSEPPEDEMQDAPEEDDDEDDDEDEEKGEFKRVATDMTVTQEKRFDNIVERMEKKVKQTFGQTAEDVYTMEKLDGQFQGEEVSQTIQVSSRGVTYWITVAAAKEVK